MIEDILPFVLNTKRPLSDIWLLSYEQNSLGVFEINEILNFFGNTENCFGYISRTKYRSEAVLYSKRTAGYPLITSYNEANHKNYDNRSNGDDPKNEDDPKSEEDLKKQRQPPKTKATSKNKEDLKSQDYLQKEDNLKNKDNINDEDDLNNENKLQNRDL